MIGRSSRRLRDVLLLSGILSALAVVATASPPLTNADIEKLVENKISDAAILDLIRTRPVTFDLSTDAIVRLKKKGTSDAVIEAMIKRSSEAAVASPQPEPPLKQPSTSNTFFGHVTDATWHGCYRGRFCYQPGTLSWSQEGVWFSMEDDESFYGVDKWTDLEFNLSWSAVNRICLDDGPWNTWVRLYAGSQVYKFQIGGLQRKRWGSYILNSINQAKESGFEGLKHVALSFSCG